MLRRSANTVSASVIREARMRERDGGWLDSAGATLPRRYQGKYVAVKNRRIVAASSTMRDLYRNLDELGAWMVLIAKVERPSGSWR